MSEVMIPAFAAVDVEAHLTEWALNVLVSMPAFERRVFNHLAMVDEVTALLGLIVAMKSLETSFLNLSSWSCSRMPVRFALSIVPHYL